MVLTSMLMSMSILSLKLEFENVLMSMLIVNPGIFFVASYLVTGHNVLTYC